MAQNFGQSLSTGNKLVDLLGGGLYGMLGNKEKPGKYYVQANYQGGGLARTGLGYMQNQNYRNPYDMAQATSAVFNNALKKIADLKNKDLRESPYTLQGDLKNPPYEDYGQYSLPTQDYDFNIGWLNNKVPSQYVFDNGYIIPQSLGFLNR